MRAWPFSKPKTPGFGISRGFYLTVLSSKSVLPSIAEVVNPGGAGGAAEGMGVPLGEDSDKSLLIKPMQRGSYAIASKDRKTVLRMVVVSKEEAGFDPERFVHSSRAIGADEELIARMRGTWTIAQIVFESHDPDVYPALNFFFAVAIRLAILSEGVVADSICERYRLPSSVLATDRVNPLIDARDLVAVKFQSRPDGLHVFTLGMQKFALEEYEILNLSEDDAPIAENFLLNICQQVLLGKLTRQGDRFGKFEVADGGFDKKLWEGISVFELRPPTTMTASEALLGG